MRCLSWSKRSPRLRSCGILSWNQKTICWGCIKAFRLIRHLFSSLLDNCPPVSPSIEVQFCVSAEQRPRSFMRFETRWSMNLDTMLGWMTTRCRTNRLLKKSSSFVLDSSKSSTYPCGYASGFDSPAALLDGLFEHPVGVFFCCALHADHQDLTCRHGYPASCARL